MGSRKERGQTSVFDAAFDEFWKAYPRHVAKGTARGAWSKAARKATSEVIIAGAERYRNDPNREDRFTAHPATWLNGERWEDDPLPSRTGRTAYNTPDADRTGESGRLRI